MFSLFSKPKKPLPPLRLLVLAGAGRSHLEFVLSWRFLRGAAISLAIGLALFVGLGGFSAFSARQLYSGWQARRENSQLKSKLQALEVELGNAETRLAQAEEATVRFAELAGVAAPGLSANQASGGYSVAPLQTPAGTPASFVGPRLVASQNDPAAPPPPDENLERVGFLSLKLMRLANAMPVVEKALIRRQELNDARPALFPVPAGHVTNRFGMRNDPFTESPGFHEGTDIAAQHGSWVLATGTGVVTFAGWRGGYGNVIEITHLGDFITRYAHLAAFRAPVGYKVKRGQVIALVGSTGRSTGPHCHYEVEHAGRLVNPSTFFTPDSK